MLNQPAPVTMVNKICPVCGLPWDYALSNMYVNGVQTCLHDGDVKGPSKIEKRRKENSEISAQARQQAGEHARNTPREEMVRITEKNKTVEVPKKLVDNLTERIKPVIGS